MGSCFLFTCLYFPVLNTANFFVSLFVEPLQFGPCQKYRLQLNFKATFFGSRGNFLHALILSHTFFKVTILIFHASRELNSISNQLEYMLNVTSFPALFPCFVTFSI